MATMQRVPGSLAYGMAQPAAPLPPQTLGFQSPATPTFAGTVPNAQPTQGFNGPDPATFARTPGSLYLQDQQQKAIQRGAAARGTLLTGGLQKALQANAEGLASTDYGNAYQRALDSYNTNRATQAQNFGQAMDQYSGSLAGFNANAQAGLGYGNLGLNTAETTAGLTRSNALDTRDYNQSLNDYGAQQNLNTAQAQADEYARQVELQRQNNAMNTPGGTLAGPLRNAPAPNMPLPTTLGSQPTNLSGIPQNARVRKGLV